MSRSQRDKGKRGERELAAVLTAAGFPARRGAQYRGGPDSPDVLGVPGLHVECKLTERLRLYEALAQAGREAPPGSTPVVMHRANRKKWVAILDLGDFLVLLTEQAGLLAELAAIQEAIRSGAARERERIVVEFGDCCQGADPACMGSTGCLLIQAMNRPEARAAAGVAESAAAESELAEVRAGLDRTMARALVLAGQLAEARAELEVAQAREGEWRKALGPPELLADAEYRSNRIPVLRALLAAPAPPPGGLLELLVSWARYSGEARAAVKDAESEGPASTDALRAEARAFDIAAAELRAEIGLPAAEGGS